MTDPIGRRAVVDRHRIRLDAPHPEHVISVGNGDFAYTADITGMQTFTAFHDPVAGQRAGRTVVNTATMANWGWHEMPNPDEFTLDDAMTTYETARGPVSYPDRHDMMGAMTGAVADEFRAGAWLNANPQRVDLGRIGLELRASSDAEIDMDPRVLSDVEQTLDLWTGAATSRFSYAGESVQVETVAASDDATVAFRISSRLLTDGRARVVLRFPYPSDGFFQTDDWDAADCHTSTLEAADDRVQIIRRAADASAYTVSVTASSGVVQPADKPHTFALHGPERAVEVVARFAPSAAAAPLPTFDEVTADAAGTWATFWSSGSAIDLAGSTDPRASELERRIILSQYLTRVHGAGSLPPAETGLLTNSWQGKFHLEMHLWHAAHFAAWGRPDLLERSLPWYLSVLDQARSTAARQGYPGARWPKQTGPDGRESPSDIGSLLAWQQPHIIHLLELAWQAGDDAARSRLVETYGVLVAETATFMAAFAEEREGAFHLGPPIMPAQEFYDARTTTDPTFELAYWWWGLETAQQWRERAGHERDADWQRVQDHLDAPHIVGGRYAAVASTEPLRRDDHPSLLMAYGLVPPTPLIDPEIMRATLDDVWAEWDWPTAWGWDFPVLAMTAARLGDTDLVLDALLRDEEKNRYTAVGHNPQMRSMLPLYLPGNGGLLLAVALLARTGAFSADGWDARIEGFSVGLPERNFDGRTRVEKPTEAVAATREPVRLTADTTIGDWLDHPVGHESLSGFLARTGASADSLGPLRSMPLSQLVALSQGAMPASAIDALVAAADAALSAKDRS